MKTNPPHHHLVALFLSLCVGSGFTAAGDPPPTATQPPPLTPSVMHVTVPGEIGKPAQEGWIQPSGALKTDAHGNLIQDMGQPSLTPVPSSPAGASPKAKKPVSAAPAAPVSIPVGPAPSGPVVATGANTASIRGTVKAYEPGKLLTMTVKGTGKDVTYTLKPGASVPDGLKAGNFVRIRVLTAEKGKVADRVEIIPKP